MGSTQRTRGPDLVDEFEHHREVHLKAVGSRPDRMELQEPFFDQRLEVHPDGLHVPDVLALGLLEDEHEALLAPLARGVGKGRGDARLSGACLPGDEDRRPAVESLCPEHRVEPGNPGGDPLVRCDVGEGHRGDREDRDAVAADEERVFVGAMDAAPVLDDPEAAGRDLVRDPVVERDDAVRDVLFEPVLGDGPVPAFPRDDGRDAPVLEPEEEPRAPTGGSPRCRNR